MLGAAAVAQPLPVAPEVASAWRDKSLVSARHWMVATANPLATDAGYRVLAAGGSAVDAAVAIQLVLGLVEPQSSGLGGGAFMLVHDARSGRAVVYDGRETAPAAATPQRFLDADGKPLAFHAAVVGGRSVGVPGVPRLLAQAHAAHGRLPWAQLFQPAIDLAEHGFPVSPRLHALIASERYFRQPRIRAYFLDATGAPLAVGTRLVNPAYAATLRTLAREGADAFYQGAIADDVIATANDYAPNPGDLTREDLARYRVVTREPVCGHYHALRVCGPPPPSSGGITLLEMLGMLEPYPLADMGAESLWSVHFIGEAGTLAYADRDAWIADPAYFAVPAGLLDRAYLRDRGALIRTDSVFDHAAPGIPPGVVARVGITRGSPGARGDIGTTPEFPSTSHIVIVDGDGNAVTMTTTIEDQFGSRLMTAGGFLLNNELTDFSFVPERDGKPVPNRVEPGKRPRSAMAPTIVYGQDGRVLLLLGSPGGSAIINYVAKTLVAIVDWHLDPQAAIALGNFGSRNGPLELERGTAVAGLASRLTAMGHAVVVNEQTSGVQAIMRVSNGWVGGADPRREGTVRGR
ncbi:MAG: gamma-glutamyltransferase [Proteobacteria bacterium]|nr:gamma-glutamyltransferase [Pseudomonadota bacterium]